MCIMLWSANWLICSLSASIISTIVSYLQNICHIIICLYMHKIGHNKYCHITHSWTQYTFHNLRDFHRTRDDQEQEEHWTIDTFDINKLVGVDIDIVVFSRRGIVAHTMLHFHFSDEKEVVLSIEGQLNEGKQYSFFTAMWGWYRNLFIRWTPQDLYGIRHLRKEPIRSYPLHLSQEVLVNLFKDCVYTTNRAYETPEKYTLINNNCTSALRKIARRHLTQLPRRHRSLLFAPWLPYFLKKKWALKLTEKKRY